jgi:hypothetical protein
LLNINYIYHCDLFNFEAFKMKTKKLSSAKTLLLASASKLALASGMASAQGGGKGDEGAPANPAPQLKLQQFVKPVDAFIPALNDLDITAAGSQFEDEFADYDNAGMIFVGGIPEEGARMDFIVSHIRNDKPVNVYVVCGTQLAPDEEGDFFPGLDMDLGDYIDFEDYYEDVDTRQAAKPEKPGLLGKKPKPGKKPNPGKGNKPPKVLAGEICVDLETEMEILAGVRVQPSMPVFTAPDTKLGKVLEPKYTSTIISVHLSKEKLQQLGVDGQELFFQAAAIPEGGADPFAETQVSECDRYLIEPIIEGEGGEPGDPGTKLPNEPTTDSTATDGPTDTTDDGGKG